MGLVGLTGNGKLIALSKTCPMKALVILALAMCFVPLVQEGPVQNEDARLKAIKEEIEKTTPEGKEIIERVKQMLPEVNGKLSTLPLENLVENYAKENVTTIGWAAARKRNGRWRILFYYQDDRKDLYFTAEWEYNPETIKLYPFDLVNAPQFWSGPTPR